MATTTRQSTKTITMPSATMGICAPSRSGSRSASRRRAADFASRWIGKRKVRMRPMKLRKKRDW